MTGRPTIYTEALADSICERLIEGESLRKICRDDDMPSAGTVCRWLADDMHEGFREQYARTRENQADTLFDDVLDIADSATVEGVQVARLKIDARKWMAGKMRAKKYGDKLDVGITGEIGIKRLERVIHKAD